MLTISSTCSTYYCIFFHFTALQSSLVMMTGKDMGCSYTGGPSSMALLTRQFAVQKSQQQMQMNWRSGHILYLFLHWKATPQMIFTMVMRQLYSTNLFLIELIAVLMTSQLVSTKCKDRLTLLIITNMDGSDHRKLSVKNPHCLQKKYEMTVNEMAVDWYASKNAWMTGDIRHRIMTKFNNQMTKAGCIVLYVCDNASSHQV